VWPAEDLNFALTELRREFSTLAAERIVRAVETATRQVSIAQSRVRLLQCAREALREQKT
jgi:hypothetical protein